MDDMMRSLRHHHSAASQHGRLPHTPLAFGKAQRERCRPAIVKISQSFLFSTYVSCRYLARHQRSLWKALNHNGGDENRRLRHMHRTRAYLNGLAAIGPLVAGAAWYAHAASSAVNLDVAGIRIGMTVKEAMLALK